MLRSTVARAVAVTLSLSGVPPAAARSPEDPERWKIGAELSSTAQTGDREPSLFTGGLAVSRLEREASELAGSLQSRYGRSDGEVVARSHSGSLALDLHPRSLRSPFLFGTAGNDAFQKLDLRLSLGAGARLTPPRAPDRAEVVSASLALLYVCEDRLDAGGRRTARASLRVRGRREPTPGLTIHHVTYYPPAVAEMADYLLRSEPGARVTLSKRFAPSIVHQVIRTARPPEGVEPSDRLLRTGLIIDL